MTTNSQTRVDAAHDILEVVGFLTKAVQHLLQASAIGSESNPAIGLMAMADADLRCIHHNYPELFPHREQPVEEVSNG